MTDELGSRQRDLSTSSVTKRANGYWHAIIASSCRWSQREYKRQPVHRINHSFASEPSGGVSLLLSYPASEETSERVRALQRSSGGRGLTGEKRNGSREDSHTRSVRWPAPLRASALKERISLKEYTGDRVFLKMSYHPCVSGCGRSLAPQDGHDHCLTCLGIQHAEEAFVDGSCSSCGDMTIRSCAIDSAVSNMAGSLCLCRDLAFALAHGAAQHPVESEVIWGLRWGLPQVEFLTPQALRSRRGYRWFGLGPLLSGVPHPFPSALPWWPDVDRCIGGWALSLRGWRLGCVAPFGCGSVVRARPRDDGFAFPGRRERRARVESSTASRPF